MIAEQNNCCKICLDPFLTTSGRSGPHLDHNHETGEIRGVLCQRCNRVLGLLKDKAEIMLNAHTYLLNNGKAGC